MNEQTVMEIYTVDEVMVIDGQNLHQALSPRLEKALQVGSICNNSLRNEAGVYVGQSTDVALVNVLGRLGKTDGREVCVRSHGAAIEN